MSFDDHPLATLHRLATANGWDDLELIVEHGEALVRLRSHKANIWAMRKSEDGSMLDRWASDDGFGLVKFTEAEIGAGPQALLDRLSADRKER